MVPGQVAPLAAQAKSVYRILGNGPSFPFPACVVQKTVMLSRSFSLGQPRRGAGVGEFKIEQRRRSRSNEANNDVFGGKQFGRYR